MSEESKEFWGLFDEVNERMKYDDADTALCRMANALLECFEYPDALRVMRAYARRASVRVKPSPTSDDALAEVRRQTMFEVYG